MAILVTGGAGYNGSVTVDHLRERDENVVVLSASSSDRSQSSTLPVR
jgi:nucleoside-diphosphate-sugar epimerase